MKFFNKILLKLQHQYYRIWPQGEVMFLSVFLSLCLYTGQTRSGSLMKKTYIIIVHGRIRKNLRSIHVYPFWLYINYFVIYIIYCRIYICSCTIFVFNDTCPTVTQMNIGMLFHHYYIISSEQLGYLQQLTQTISIVVPLQLSDFTCACAWSNL